MSKECIGCGSCNFVLKSVSLPVKDVNNKDLKNKIWEMLPITTTEMFYAKICVDCGRTDFYSASIIEKETKKRKSNLKQM